MQAGVYRAAMAYVYKVSSDLVNQTFFFSESLVYEIKYLDLLGVCIFFFFDTPRVDCSG
jgi:hypothetical protein